MVAFVVGRVCAKHPELLGKRYAANRQCNLCAAEYQRHYYSKNPGVVRKRVADWAKEHPARAKERGRQWYQKNRIKALERSARYRIECSERVRQWYIDNVKYRRIRHAQWKRDNRAHCTAHEQMRKAAKLQRTPRWLTADDLAQIDRMYMAAAQATYDTGIKHSVDHFYPLRGKSVSGLHVPANLRVITAIENCRKNNWHPNY